MDLQYLIDIEHPDDAQVKWQVKVVIHRARRECVAEELEVVRGLKPAPGWVLDYAREQAEERGWQFNYEAEAMADAADRRYDEQRDKEMGV